MLVFVQPSSVFVCVVSHISVTVHTHTPLWCVSVGQISVCFACNSRDGLLIISSVEDFLSSLPPSHTHTSTTSLIPSRSLSPSFIAG